MDRFLTNLPVITRMEVAVVAATVLFLFVAPMLLAWGDARRRRREMRVQVGTAVSYAPVSSVDAPPTAELVVPGVESAPPPATTDVESSPSRRASAAGAAQPQESSPARSADASADLRVQSAAPFAETAVPAVAPRLSDALPALQVTGFDPPPPASAWSEACQLIELRQARLADWPPDSVRRDPERRRIWEDGERLETRFDRQISTTALSLPTAAQAAALGGVETDGVLFRLHFLLFEDLWPTAPAQAAAEAVFEIDPTAGVLASWVEKR